MTKSREGYLMSMVRLQAREKAGQDETWHAYLFEVKDSPYGSFLEVTGKVCPLYVKGGRAGKPNYNRGDSSTKVTVQIGLDEHWDWVEAWEAATGTCAQCENTGLEWCGWSEAEGSRYRPCRRCGQQQQQEVAA